MPTPTDPGAPSEGRQLPYALRALRHRNFCLFFAGQLVSRTGYWMQGMAQGWLVYRLSQSSFMLGMVAFAGQIPAVVLGPFGGVVADRFSRYKICLYTQILFMAQALILGALTTHGVITVWQVFLLALVAGTLQTFEMPARQAFLQEIVGKEDLTSAIALNSALVNAARIVGPALAGLLVAMFDEGVCFTVNGICYLAIIGGFMAMEVPPSTERSSNASVSSFIREGMSYAFHTPAIRLLLMLIGVISLLSTPYTVLMPIFAKDVLHGGPDAMGLLLGAAGAGAVIGVMFLARQRSAEDMGRFITFALIRFGIGMILFSISRHFWLSMLLLPLIGSGFMVPMAAANTLLQTLTPDRLRGRVMSLFLMMFMGAPPLGSLLSGFLAPHIGAPMTVGLTGVGCLFAALWFWLRASVLHHTASELEDESTMPTTKAVESKT